MRFIQAAPAPMPKSTPAKVSAPSRLSGVGVSPEPAQIGRRRPLRSVYVRKALRIIYQLQEMQKDE